MLSRGAWHVATRCVGDNGAACGPRGHAYPLTLRMQAQIVAQTAAWCHLRYPATRQQPPAVTRKRPGNPAQTTRQHPATRQPGPKRAGPRPPQVRAALAAGGRRARAPRAVSARKSNIGVWSYNSLTVSLQAKVSPRLLSRVGYILNLSLQAKTSTEHFQ